ncbi:DUF2231 domain-containing protein [Niabella ginsengisoli]|uniref:DUF2231 domain-containing protein n=1 Tax=Niabella ginsengisoli TaxID=522298 RepID=A0ABS9SJU0_9BACT|nr:DUF2231 domain-containing protein [Niabella ginsengisoli]MCH5598585.1 hypothetical protein [Niabella ginsengisoli]
MKQWKWQSIIFNFCIVLNCLLLFLLIFGNQFIVPTFLQTFGRAHPLVLHFPIVLLLLAFLFEMLIVSPKQAMLKDIADWLLLAAALTTVVAALMGLFLSKEEGYESNAIDVHKWTGVACAFISFMWYGLKESIRKKNSYHSYWPMRYDRFVDCRSQRCQYYTWRRFPFITNTCF